MVQLGYDRYYTELEAEAVRFAEAVHDADLARQVPTCPEWTLAQLVAHVGQAHRWATAIVVRRSPEPLALEDVDDLRVPEDAAERAEWLRAGAARLVEAVREAGPETPVWTFTDEHYAGFWVRRMLYETLVHRADAELTVGRAVTLDPELAADGISEGLGLLTSSAAAANPAVAGLRGDGQTLHFHATDEGLGEAGEWVVRRTPSGVVWEHGHVKADVAVRARAADLLLVLQRRIPPSAPRIEVLGDEELFHHWLDHTAF
ncbi:hypothetical protein TH66_07880 [Carbonactinospora thermoautotrophica]|uniref:Mycothiol-dependent maleylpyruvate isomerase metal-binding domain-containing protein n=1 Tax=Carbonactinospora thermoautotrophica TaxID=1469144 RepID=A0A132N385_9ACTN|nr:maleylpyruvate isomerase family mycothiol-dependent enzyme [Carbonactinospora thermoautotrophica]KWX04476.1 hypothetical protein TH66_07880 [Carbonactinospora thermoautotrophica]KWX08778.1 hypothetical protein TR74_13475 [Carbonactinospora thermoautotrophica]